MHSLQYPLALGCIVVLLFAGVPAVGINSPGLAYLLAIALLVAFVAVVGFAVTGHWVGVLIDDRNVISLSRFQMAVWTCVLLAAILTAALLNIPVDALGALDITIPDELWALMGISVTSMVASPLILSTKAKPPTDTQADRVIPAPPVADDVGGPPKASAARGHLAVNSHIDHASWMDLFTGEEVGNAAHLDLTRIQMFFFTLVSVAAYSASLISVFRHVGPDGIHALPSFSSTLVTLLGISHAGYLTAKAVPHTTSAAGGTPLPDMLSPGNLGVAVPAMAPVIPVSGPAPAPASVVTATPMPTPAPPPPGL
jgi:hypothetical protein